MCKKVSAIITTHNRAELLIRAIESVLNQTYSNIECIILDDHSTDNTREICNRYHVHYIYIPESESHGGNYARNLGIKASSGIYCAFLDDDDYWFPTKIEKQVRLIEEKSCELIYCGVRTEFVEKSGFRYEDTLPEPKASGDMSKKILQYIVTTTSCILSKRDALIEIGLFDEELRFWQEYDLCIRLAQRKPFYYVDEPLVVYRQDKRDKNRLTNKYWEWREAVKYIHRKYASLYKKLNLIENYRVHNMIWNDAKTRCESSGLKLRSLYFNVLTIPLKVRSLIKKR